MNDVERVISELERQRSAIERAISALREVAGPATTEDMSADGPKLPARKKRRLSAEGRRRIIEGTKNRWAAKRAAQKQQAAQPTSEAPRTHSGKEQVAKKSSPARKKASAKQT